MPRRAVPLAAVLLAVSTAAQVPASKRASGTSSAPQTRNYYYQTPRSSLDVLVHTVPATDPDRFRTLQEAFSRVQCTGDRMRTQIVDEKHDSDGRNLVCAWPASSPDTILVVAHYNREGKGAAALDDWSGAALMPALYLALQAQPRHNTWIFLESAGQKGDEAFLKSLSHAAQKHIRAVIALDALGLDSALRFFSPTDTPDPSLADFHLQLELLAASVTDPRLPRPQPADSSRWLATDDTRLFRYRQIPAIVLHSIPPNKTAIPGSANDVPFAIDANAYYDNYRALAVYFISLDTVASKLTSADEKFWGAQSGYRLNLNDLPYIH